MFFLKLAGMNRKGQTDARSEAVIQELALKIKRQETPLYRSLYNVARKLQRAKLPLPKFMHPILKSLYFCHQGLFSFLRRAGGYSYIEPLFRGRCESIGRHFTIHKMPFVVGHAKIRIGDDVNFFGKVDIFTGRMFDNPALIIHNRVDIGSHVTFVVNKEIVIEDDVNVASNAIFMDSDSHPRDVAERIADLPPRPEEIRAVRICKNAWIGRGAVVLKGVTIGEGAIIGINSVVVTDIPAYSVAMGNPARVVVKNIRPATSGPPDSPDVKI